MLFVRHSFVILMSLLAIIGTEAWLYDNMDQEGILFYSMGSGIRKCNLGMEKDISWLSDESSRVVGIAVSPQPNVVYWSDIQPERKMIMSISDNIFGSPELVADVGLVNPEKLAVDWVTGNLYFIDTYKKHIGVCTADGSYCKIILDQSILDLPGSLVLNPKSGEMFWSDYGSKASIWKAGMDGSKARAIVTEDLGWPKGLAIDYQRERLYWSDSKLQTVESTNLGGTDRRRFLRTEGKQIRSLLIFREELYWNDWQSNTIESVDISTGGNRKYLVNSSELIYDFDIYHDSFKPPMLNPCQNQGCSELCLLAPDHQYSCGCQVGYVLNADLRTCNAVNELPHLVIAAGDKLIHYYEVIVGKARIKITFTPIRMSQIVYDRNTANFIADDQITNSFYSLDPVNNEIRWMTSVNSKNLGGLDFNYKNNITSWSDTRLGHICQIGPNESSPRRYGFMDVPVNILSIPEYENSFVAFNTVDHGFRIVWQNPAGVPRTILSNMTESKICFAFDERSERMYFAGARAGIIESVSVESIARGSIFLGRQVLCSGAGRPVSLAVLNGKLYWTNDNSNVLRWVDLDDDYSFIKSTILPIENEKMQPAQLVTMPSEINP